MEAFIQQLLEGAPPAGVVDLCLDYSLTRTLRKAKFERIAGLEGFTDLEQLSISGHALQDAHGLTQLQRLKSLCLSLNELESLAGLPSLPRLQSLDLSHNALDSLEALPALPSLVEFNLAHNHLRSLTPLGSLHSLQSLSLSGNRPLRDLDGLQALPGLKKLFLKQCYIGDWAVLAALKQLEELSISPGEMAGLEILTELPMLESLHLHGARLHGEVVLPPLPHVQHLGLVGGAQIHAVAGLQHAPGLRTLSLRGNGLTALPALDGLIHLEQLDLGHNPIPDLRGWVDLPALRRVSLQNTGVSAGELGVFRGRCLGVEVVA